MTEAEFITALRGLATDPAARGLADDCAVLEVGSETLVLTHDSLVAGVHFLATQDPADIAWKLVATNVSDLAAKGAQPRWALLSYQLGGDDQAFLAGLEAALAHYGGIALLGGDTVSANGPQALGLTLIGTATHRPVPARSGARAGDGVWLCGALGAAMLGYEALREGTGADSSAYRRPLARLVEGRQLAPVVNAMMDVSDGLLLDARRMAEASGVTIALDTAAVPLAAPEDRRSEALRWGDDYALLFTAAPNAVLPPGCSPIGTVLPRAAEPLLLDGVPPARDDRLGYLHRPAPR